MLLVLTIACLTPGCGVKVEHLPLIEYPYVSEIEFLKEVKNVNGKAKKKRFKQDLVTSPFYFYLKIKEIENNGTVTVAFYSGEKETRKTAEKRFNFGTSGKYYEYIIFFDRVDELKPGKHRWAVFINGRLLYEGHLQIHSRK